MKTMSASSITAASEGAGSNVWLFVPSGTMPTIRTCGPPTFSTMFVIGPQAEEGQREAVARTRSQRDQAAADGALAHLADAAATDDAELIGPMVECARVRCTEGEIVRALAGVFGDYRETPRF